MSECCLMENSCSKHWSTVYEKACMEINFSVNISKSYWFDDDA